MKYFIDEDDDGYNYLVPADKREEWEQYLENIYEFWNNPGALPDEEPFCPAGVIEINRAKDIEFEYDGKSPL